MTAPVPTGYPMREVLRRSGLSYRQLDYWCHQGWISERQAAAIGSGYARLFSEEEMRRVVFAAGLLAIGFTTKAALAQADRLMHRDSPISHHCNGVTVTISRR